ncbi:actin-related protein 5 [Nematocida sp. ERTm5]|nr:actin-related protein 5 [Nematocida sp. ERTm5]
MGSLLVIDNGTYECKAGTNKDIPSVKFRNQIYRTKGKDGKASYSISVDKNQNTPSTVKSMFDGMVVYNYDVFEGTIKSIMKEVKIGLNTKEKEDIKELVITECFLNPKVFHDMAIESIFNTFSFKKVHIGYDMLYSYEYNIQNNSNMSLDTEGFKREFCDVIISMGYMGVYVIPVDPVIKSILYEESTYMPLGSLAAQYIFCRSISNKYCGTGVKVQKEDVIEYFKDLKVPLDYLKEIEGVVHEGVGNVQILQKPGKEKTAPIRNYPKRKPAEEIRKKTKALVDKEKSEESEESTETRISDTVTEKEAIEEEAEEVVETAETNSTQKESELMNEEELAKKLKREKLIKGATDHRNKQKILKSLERLNYHIFILEDRYLLINNPGEFMKLRRDRLEYLEKIIKKRTFVRNELKNKKSTHSLALLKKSLEHPDTQSEDNVYLQDIQDASLDDSAILDEIEQIDGFLRENDPEYIKKEENPLDKIRYGHKEKGGININVEFIRTAEALFNPAIVGIEQPGLTESLSNIMHTKDVRNIFITGGFSQIKGLKERIQKEIIPLRYMPNDPCVVSALDPVNDAYRGAFLKSEYAKTYTKKEYMEQQAKKKETENNND